MSGGSFDYAYWGVSNFAEELEIKIREGKEKNEYGEMCNDYSDEVIDKLKEIEQKARYISNLMKEVEWLYSGDIDEELFLENVKEIKNNDMNFKTETQLLQELEQAQSLIDMYKRDAKRYAWLRDRMKVYYETPLSGGNKRATLAMRIGYGFLDSTMRPESGWTDQKCFDKCRSKVDNEIDKAMLNTEKDK